MGRLRRKSGFKRLGIGLKAIGFKRWTEGFGPSTILKSDPGLLNLRLVYIFIDRPKFSVTEVRGSGQNKGYGKADD